MHKRGLCGRAVSLRPSRSWILSKWTNISLIFFKYSFPYQTSWQYSDGFESEFPVTVLRRQNSTFRKSDFRKLGSVAVLPSFIRILRASLTQIDTEKAEKYAKLAEKYAEL